jgi:hypothetical protein
MKFKKLLTLAVSRIVCSNMKIVQQCSRKDVASDSLSAEIPLLEY